MFPVYDYDEKKEKGKQESDILTVYRGQKIAIGIQLTVDKEWRYSLQSNEKLTVQIRTDRNEVVLEKVYTADDVDPDDKIITARFDEKETQEFNVGDFYITAFVDGYMIFTPKKIKVKDVIEYVEPRKESLF